MDGGRLLMNWVMERNTKRSGTARRDDIDQGLWILAWISSCSKSNILPTSLKLTSFTPFDYDFHGAYSPGCRQLRLLNWKKKNQIFAYVKFHKFDYYWYFVFQLMKLLYTNLPITLFSSVFRRPFLGSGGIISSPDSMQLDSEGTYHKFYKTFSRTENYQLESRAPFPPMF